MHWGGTREYFYVLEIQLITPGMEAKTNQQLLFRCPECTHNVTTVYMSQEAACNFNLNKGYIKPDVLGAGNSGTHVLVDAPDGGGMTNLFYSYVLEVTQ